MLTHPPAVVMKFGINIQKQLLLLQIQHIEKMLEVLLQAGYISLYSSAYSTAGGEWCNKILCRQIKQHSLLFASNRDSSVKTCRSIRSPGLGAWLLPSSPTTKHRWGKEGGNRKKRGEGNKARKPLRTNNKSN